MTWDTGTFEQKLARIDRAIDRSKGKRVVIIGESAGGSMAVHMYARRPDDFYKVMTLCGKNIQPEKVDERYYMHHPAFRTSMERLNESLAQLTDKQRKRFVSIHPLYDPVVPVRETLIPGCRQVRLLAIGHFTVIILALTVLSPQLVRAARRK
jgi:predicted peptidase